jgi:hypothetical protein
MIKWILDYYVSKADVHGRVNSMVLVTNTFTGKDRWFIAPGLSYIEDFLDAANLIDELFFENLHITTKTVGIRHIKGIEKTNHPEYLNYDDIKALTE